MTYFGELWMALFGGFLLFMYQYLVVYIKNEHVWQNRASSTVHMVSGISRVSSLDHVSPLAALYNSTDLLSSFTGRFRFFG